MRAIVPTSIVALIPTLASAHPDHSGAAAGLAHFVSDPFHVATYGICALAAVVLGSLAWRRRAPVRKR